MKKTVLTLVALLMAMTTLAQRTAIILAHRGGGTEGGEILLDHFPLQPAEHTEGDGVHTRVGNT